jgi:hypothetical protein
LRAQRFKEFFDLFEILCEPTDEALGLTTQGRDGQSLGLLALSHEGIEYLHPAADQFGQRLFLFGAWGGGFGLQGLTIGGEDGGINVIGLGPLAGGAGEVADAGGVQDADGHLNFVEGGNDVTFVTAGGFTDDLNARVGGQEFQQPAMPVGAIGQVMDPPGEVKLQVILGNIQASIDSGHSVRAHSCKYEQALAGRSINGSSLGHRHERLRLPAHLVKNQCQRVTNSFAPLSCRLQAAGQFHLPKSTASDKVRGKRRYKRAGVRGKH